MIKIERNPWREMVNHAQATWPNECCGAMLGSSNGEGTIVTDAIALENSFEGSQQTYYVISKDDLERADRLARERKLDLIGIYHSHPDCDAYFSTEDLKHSCPWYSFVILSIKNGRFDHANCWKPDLDQTHAEKEELIWPES
jgi:proteasome lid subunit RPN8/RPN11